MSPRPGYAISLPFIFDARSWHAAGSRSDRSTIIFHSSGNPPTVFQQNPLPKMFSGHFVSMHNVCWRSQWSILVVSTLASGARGPRIESRFGQKVRVFFSENHCDTQLWAPAAHAAHWLQCLGRLSLPPSKVWLSTNAMAMGECLVYSSLQTDLTLEQPSNWYTCNSRMRQLTHHCWALQVCDLEAVGLQCTATARP